MAKRTIISMLLIFTYTVGFAHNLIPHCNDDHTNGVHVETHHHAHHTHASDDRSAEDHSHVEHGDHFDEGFLDYLVCLFEGIQHHDNACDVECYPQANQVKYSTENLVSTDAVIATLGNQFHIENTSVKINSDVQQIQSQKGLDTSPGRAPPHTYL